MTAQDDDLGGYEDLSPMQRQLVNRYRNKARRHDHTGYVPTNRDRWDTIHAAERANEERQIWRGGNR